MVTKKITWDAALQICEQENSRLAMPKNLEQFNFVLNKIAKPASQDQYWIGVKFANSSFYYVDGQKFKLQLWEEDEPDMSTNQACVAVKKGEMFDRRCKDERPFVCEAGKTQFPRHNLTDTFFLASQRADRETDILYH